MANYDFTPDNKDFTNEQWRDVPGYEGLYQVSDYGRVQRIANRSDGHKIKHGFLNPMKAGWNGQYRTVALTRNNKTVKRYIHRLVLIAFYGHPPTPKHQVNHKDGDKTNNCLSNLEWVTPLQNQHHRYDVLGKHQNGESNGSNKYSQRQIEHILSMHRSGRYTQRKIAAITGIDYRYVSQIVRREAWRHLD